MAGGLSALFDDRGGPLDDRVETRLAVLAALLASGNDWEQSAAQCRFELSWHPGFGIWARVGQRLAELDLFALSADLPGTCRRLQFDLCDPDA